MAITYRTVTGNLADLLRADFDPASVRITVRTNLDPGDAPIDETNNQILLGTGRVIVASDGTFSTTNVIDHASTDVNPTGIQYRWDIDYTPRNGQRVTSWSSGFVNVTANADLATLVAMQYVPPSYQGEFIAQAEALLAQQEQIAGLADSDAAQAYNVDHGPLTRGALLATIEDTINGIDVWLLAGQSNMQGGDNTVDSAIDIADPRLLEWPSSGAHVGTIQPAVDPLDHVPGPGGQVGPGIPFARWYASQVPGRQVLLVPVAWHSTGFENSNNGVPARWKVGRVQPGETNLYELAITQANAAMAAAGPGARFAGILWCQGEADQATAAATYQADLLALIDGFRSRITGAAEAPFVMLSMVPETVGSGAGYQAIQAVHVDIPYLRPRTGFAQGLAGHVVNGLHYDAVAQRWNGSVALVAAYERTLGNKVGTAPNAPTGVTVTQDANVRTTANVTWTPAKGRVTDYTVQYRSADGEAWTTLTRTRSLAPSATITSLLINSSVEVRVLTVNEAGSSTASTSGRAALLPALSVTITQTDATTVTVATVAVPGASAYRFDYKLSASSTWTFGTPQAGASVSITGLSSSAYDFRVAAYSPIGVASSTATFTLGALPINPASLTASIAQAYGARKVVQGYSGSAIRVRRSSDNTEQDIGFSSNNLDTAALLTFAGSGDAFVKTWYDQSGNSRDLTQATAASQPQIVSAGALLANNGRPGMFFDGVDDYIERSTANLWAAGSALVCGVASGTQTANVQECVLGEGGTGSNNARYFINKCAGGKFGHNVIGDASGSDVLVQDLVNPSDTPTFIPGSPRQWSWRDTGAAVYRYRGGAALVQLPQAYSRSGKTLTLNRQTVGALHRVALSTYATMLLSELVIFHTDPSTADRQVVEGNQSTYYGTPTGL